MFWHEKSPIYPYNIYIRIYKQKPQFRYDETEWIDFFKQAGLHDVTSWRANSSKDWAGTLVLTGKKCLL